MADINKIRVNKSDYNIVPQLGTGLFAENGIVGINTGEGITFDQRGKVCINLGTGLACDEEKGCLQVNLGTALVAAADDTDCGIAINNSGFIIDLAKFKNFLAALGVQFTQPLC